MRIYTVHTRPWSAAPDDDAVLVKEGFAWPAFFFPILWAPWHRLWLVLLIMVAVVLAIAGLTEFVRPDPWTQTALQLGLQAVVGFFGNDWRRHSLARRGFVETAVVAGRNRLAAEHRYFSLVDPREAVA